MMDTHAHPACLALLDYFSLELFFPPSLPPIQRIMQVLDRRCFLGTLLLLSFLLRPNGGRHAQPRKGRGISLE